MFIPAGYNAMIRTKKPDWLEDDRVKEITPTSTPCPEPSEYGKWLSSYNFSIQYSIGMMPAWGQIMKSSCSP